MTEIVNALDSLTTPEERARTQVVAKPHLANPAPIKYSNGKSNQRLVGFQCELSSFRNFVTSFLPRPCAMLRSVEATT